MLRTLSVMLCKKDYIFAHKIPSTISMFIQSNLTRIYSFIFVFKQEEIINIFRGDNLYFYMIPLIYNMNLK